MAQLNNANPKRTTNKPSSSDPGILKDNFLLINKPAGWTSFDVINYLRNRIRKSGLSGYSDKSFKVGHAGTLDPFATGLLIVGVGREATKRLDEFKSLPKTYLATLHLGAVSDTFDVTGRISDFRFKIADVSDNANSQNNKSQITNHKLEHPITEQILTVLESFGGKQLQLPPMFSAKKVNGQRLYKLARQGKEIERQPNEIEIYRLALIAYTWPLLKIEVVCSAGTYIRTLANDIGAKLGVGAYCEELTRTAIGPYRLEQAVTVDEALYSLTNKPNEE